MTTTAPSPTAQIARRIRSALAQAQVAGTLPADLTFTVRSHTSHTSDSIEATIRGVERDVITTGTDGEPGLSKSPRAAELERQVEQIMNAQRHGRGPRLFLVATVHTDRQTFAELEAELSARTWQWIKDRETAAIALVDETTEQLFLFQ